MNDYIRIAVITILIIILSVIQNWGRKVIIKEALREFAAEKQTEVKID